MLSIFLFLYIYCFWVMFTFKKHEGCHGYTLFCIGKYQAEVWVCPPHHIREMHKHPLEHTHLWFIQGKDTVIRKVDLITHQREEYTLTFPRTLCRMFYLSPKQYHGFEVGNTKLIFVNFQKWVVKPTSASVDYVPLQSKMLL